MRSQKQCFRLNHDGIEQVVDQSLRAFQSNPSLCIRKLGICDATDGLKVISLGDLLNPGRGDPLHYESCGPRCSNGEL